MATAPSLASRGQAPSQSAGQTLPQTAGNGLRAAIFSHAESSACSGVRTLASASATAVSHPRMSPTLGQAAVHGAVFTEYWGRCGPMSPPGDERWRITGFFTGLEYCSL